MLKHKHAEPEVHPPLDPEGWQPSWTLEDPSLGNLHILRGKPQRLGQQGFPEKGPASPPSSKGRRQQATPSRPTFQSAFEFSASFHFYT